MRFASDNTSGAAPEVMAALAAANDGFAPGYGADDWTRAAEAKLAEVFERACAIFFVGTGTAANSLALAAMAPPWGAVFCHARAHIEEDECGGPEFFSGGAKLKLVPGAHGRVDPAAFEAALRAQSARGVHQAQPAALSITQATEAGAVYRPREIETLAEIAHEAGLFVHMDGARFANAAARLGVAPAALSWRAGVDALCLGATKNGALGAEAILCFEPRLAETLALRRKRAGHLFSKMRFVSAQLAAWLHEDRWLRYAAHANAMADRLARGLAALPGVALTSPVEANMLFADLPARTHRALRAAGATYYVEPAWIDEETADPVGVRLVASFSTREADVDAFLSVAREAA